MKKNNILLLVVFIVFIIIAIWLLQKPGETSVSVKDSGMLVDLDSAKIDKIKVKSRFNGFEVEKQNGQWMLKNPVKYLADQNHINYVLSLCSNMKIKSIVSTNPKKQSLFMVDSNGANVKFYENGKLKADLIIGKQGDGYQSTYVRLKNSNDVVLVSGALTFLFYSPVKMWRDRTITDLSSNSINKISFKYSQKEYILQKQDSLWTLNGENFALDKAKELIKKISHLTADDFLDNPKDSLPPINAVIRLNNEELSFSLQKDSVNYIVRTSKSPQLFLVRKAKAEKLFIKE